MDRLKKLVIDDHERIFLDGIELSNVTAYQLENRAGDEPARLTMTMLVNVGQIGSVSQK